MFSNVKTQLIMCDLTFIERPIEKTFSIIQDRIILCSDEKVIKKLCFSFSFCAPSNFPCARYISAICNDAQRNSRLLRFSLSPITCRENSISNIRVYNKTLRFQIIKIVLKKKSNTSVPLCKSNWIIFSYI